MKPTNPSTRKSISYSTSQSDYLNLNYKPKTRRSDSFLNCNTANERSPDETLFETLMNDPMKRYLVLKLLSQEKNAIEEYKRNEGKKRYLQNGMSQNTLKKLKRKFNCESPSALLRRRALEKRSCDSDSSSTTSNEQLSTKLNVSFDKLLQGVIAYVEIRSKDEDRSAGAKALMQAMGAIVRENFARDVTHVVFKDGLYSTYHKAKLMKLHLVSVLWLEAVRRSNSRVSEKNYPALGTEAYDTNISSIFQDDQRDYDDIVQDEYNRSIALSSQIKKFNTDNITFRRDTTNLKSASKVLLLQDMSSPSTGFHTPHNKTFSNDCVASSQDFEVMSIFSKGSRTLPDKNINSPSVECASEINYSYAELTSDNDSDCGVVNGHIIKHLNNSLELDKSLNLKNVEIEKHQALASRSLDILFKNVDKNEFSKNSLHEKGRFCRASNLEENVLVKDCEVVLDTPCNTDESAKSTSLLSHKKVKKALKYNESVKKRQSEFNIDSDIGVIDMDLTSNVTGIDNYNANSATRNKENISVVCNNSARNSSLPAINPSKCILRKSTNMDNIKIIDLKIIKNSNVNKVSGSTDISLLHISECGVGKKTVDNSAGDSSGTRLSSRCNKTSNNSNTMSSLRISVSSKVSSTSSDMQTSKQNNVLDMIQNECVKSTPNRVSAVTNTKNSGKKKLSSSRKSKGYTKKQGVSESVIETETTIGDILNQEGDLNVDNQTDKNMLSPSKHHNKNIQEQPDKSKKITSALKNKKTRKLYNLDESTYDSVIQWDVNKRTSDRLKTVNSTQSKNTNLLFYTPMVLTATARKYLQNKMRIQDTNNQSKKKENVKTVESKPKSVKKSVQKKQNEFVNDKDDEQALLAKEFVSKRKHDGNHTQSSPPKQCKLNSNDKQTTVHTPVRMSVRILQSNTLDKRKANVNHPKIPDLTPVITKRRSTLDFVSKTKKTNQKSNKKNENVRICSIVCTRLHRPEVQVFQQVVKKLGVFFAEDEVSNRTTHLVAGEPKRTVNLLRAIAQGCWIVKHEWLLRSLEVGKWLPEEDYELTEFSPAVRQCRLERQAFGPLYSMDIFENCGPIYIAPSSIPRRSDLQELVKLCRGTITTISRNAHIIVGEFVRHKSAACVGESWILDSITFNKKKALRKYLIRSKHNHTNS